MVTREKPFYGPALRMKPGELMGIGDLAPDIKERVLPRLIVPPSGERTENLETKLFASDPCPDISAALFMYWPGRDVMVESTYLLDEFGRDKIGMWLPKMFELARKAGVQAIPTVKLEDLLTGPEVYASAIDRNQISQLSLILSSGQLTDGELIKAGMDALDRVNITAERCILIADFQDSDFSQPELVVPVIEGVVDTIVNSAQWQDIIFQGTNYPETNPAGDDSSFVVPRNEWIAWRRAVGVDGSLAKSLTFGDYAADCAKINFGGSGFGAIPHYRYATPDAWLVQRGAKAGKHEVVMQAVCQKIVSSGMFAGRAFSNADDTIYRTAKGASGPGNAKSWRAVNTTHHITRVVVDLGALQGVQFGEKDVTALGEQMALFSGN